MKVWNPIDKALLRIRDNKVDYNDLGDRESRAIRKQGLATFDKRKKEWKLTERGIQRVKTLKENSEKAMNIILNSLLEVTADGKNSLLLLDIDKTLVEPRNIFIYRNHPSDEKEVALTPQEFAKDSLAHEAENKKYYDFREFRDPYKVAESIKTGIPLIENLKIMDSYIKNGWEIGILTARGLENVVSNTMREWLKFRDLSGSGKLRSAAAKLSRNLIFAINDDSKSYQGFSDFDRKANVIKDLAEKYDRVFFLDDDLKNVEAVNSMAEKEGLQGKVKAMIAK